MTNLRDESFRCGRKPTACLLAGRMGTDAYVAWTDMSRWFLALIVGVNFLSTGLSLLVLSRPRKA